MKLSARILIFFFLLGCSLSLPACQKRMVQGHLPPEDRPYSPPLQEYPQIQPEELLSPVRGEETEKAGGEDASDVQIISGMESLTERGQPGEIFSTDITDSEFASSRRKAYSDKISQWHIVKATVDSLDLGLDKPELWQNCIVEMENILSGYAAIADGLPGMADLHSAVFQHDISFIESDCESIFADTIDSVAGKIDHYADLSAGQAGKVVSHYGRIEDYERVILTYQSLIGSAGRKADYDIQEIYSHALQRAGRLAEAAGVLLAVADSRKDSYNWKLRLHAADMLMAIGDFGKALEQYQKVAEVFASWSTFDETVQARMKLLQDDNYQQNEALVLYARALHAWMTGGGKEIPAVLHENSMLLERRYSGTIYAIEGEKLLNQAENSVHTYVLGMLDEARSFTADKEFNKAQAIIDALIQLKSSPESRDLVAIVGEEIKQAESEEKILQQRAMEEALDAKWQQANVFFDQKEYDKAIDLFRELVNSEYRKKAIRKIDKAVELAAVDMRKKAALLFSKSRRMNGFEKKSVLLLESRAILRGIIRRYPEAKVIDKVVANLEVIEEQINNLDPSLLEGSGSEENPTDEENGEKNLQKRPESEQDIRGSKEEKEL